jgi:hypothetical protein
MEEHLFKVEIGNDYKLKIEFGGYEKLDLLDKLAVCVAQNKKMGQWLDSPQASNDDKEKYLPVFISLIDSISSIWLMLRCAGITNKEIVEHLNIPF